MLPKEHNCPRISGDNVQKSRICNRIPRGTYAGDCGGIGCSSAPSGSSSHLSCILQFPFPEHILGSSFLVWNGDESSTSTDGNAIALIANYSGMPVCRTRYSAAKPITEGGHRPTRDGVREGSVRIFRVTEILYIQGNQNIVQYGTGTG